MRQFIQALALGVTDADTDEIIVSFYGSRGGTKATIGISPEAARKLRDDLSQALLERDPAKGADYVIQLERAVLDAEWWLADTAEAGRKDPRGERKRRVFAAADAIRSKGGR